MGGPLVPRRGRDFRRLFGALGAALVLAPAWACGGSSVETVSGNSGNGNSGGSSGSGGTDSGGSSATGGRGGAGGGAIIVDPSGGTGFAGGAVDYHCERSSIEISLRPVSLLVMVDRSGSMANEDTIDPETGLDRWQAATTAFKSFFSDPHSDGSSVALRFFPHDLPAAGCASESCDAAACAQPLVELATLSAEYAPDDAHEQALFDAIDAVTPAVDQEGGRPTGAALEGAVIWAKARQAAHPEEQTAILLVTDGQPEGCEDTTSSLDGYLTDALGTGVRTFFIGLTDAEGENLQSEDLDHLAETAGTERAYLIQDGADAASDLLETLKEVRGQIECAFPAPEFYSSGAPIDPYGVADIVYTFGNGSGSSTFTRVSDAAACNVSSSWYFDDADHPTRIQFCPSACDYARTDPKATFIVQLPCEVRMR